MAELGEMTCENFMTTPPVVIGTGQSVVEAARKMRDFDIGFLPVCASDGSPVGVITDRDLTVRVLADDKPGSTTVEQVMSGDVITCHAEDDLRQAEQLMRTHQTERVVVLDDDGRVAGVISLADLSQYEDEERAGRLLSDVRERETEVH